MVEREKTATAEIKIRVKEPLRARVAAAARERGVSMNAEFADRLERSFVQDEGLADAFGSRDLYAFMRAIAAAMTHAGEIAALVKPRPSTDDSLSWLTEPYAFDQAAKAAGCVIEAFRPPGDCSPPPIPSAHAKEAEATELWRALGSMGALSARTFISGIVHGKMAVLDDSVIEFMRSRLVPVSIADQLPMPDDAADDTDGGKHEGEYHSSRQVQLAPKIRGRRARRPNW
jgi:hypothetical protein